MGNQAEEKVESGEPKGRTGALEKPLRGEDRKKGTEEQKAE